MESAMTPFFLQEGHVAGDKGGWIVGEMQHFVEDDGRERFAGFGFERVHVRRAQ
ncbi:hypothetical protein QW131_04325 [Roseibium salinum]|nr:hypothetical protein [Roseibium salinum]